VVNGVVVVIVVIAVVVIAVVVIVEFVVYDGSWHVLGFRLVGKSPLKEEGGSAFDV
jgi:hypothetical protein